MSSQQLLEAILEGGIHSTNFFNGRRLTAEDLIREKNASRQHQRLLGRAIGNGVVYGLEVGLPSGQPTGGTDLSIKGGLAVNRKGDALCLPDPITLTLVPPSNDQHVIDADFKNCSKMAPTKYPRNTGVYVLLIRPAEDLSGSAAMSSIPDDGGIIGCGKGELVEGVRFRTVKMELGLIHNLLSGDTEAALKVAISKTDDANVSMSRNIVAHACLGTEEIEKYMTDPLAKAGLPAYGALDKLRSLTDSVNKITECDVPLAILWWTDKQIQYVDMWSVRRRLIAPNASPLMQPLSSDRRSAEGEAAFFQFQGHLQEILINQNQSLVTGKMRAVENFRYLPAAGLLPADDNGINEFFKGLPHRTPELTDEALLIPLFRESFHYPPIDLSGKNRKLVWVYRTWQSQAALGKSGVVPYVVFITGHLSHIAREQLARFDLANWDYSAFI